MAREAICAKMTEYKVLQNAGISLTKGANVTLEVFLYIAVKNGMLGHCKVTSITNMGPHPHKTKPNGEGPKRGAECQ